MTEDEREDEAYELNRMFNQVPYLPVEDEFDARLSWRTV